jgi:hypothetical protein
MILPDPPVTTSVEVVGPTLRRLPEGGRATDCRRTRAPVNGADGPAADELAGLGACLAHAGRQPGRRRAGLTADRKSVFDRLE